MVSTWVNWDCCLSGWWGSGEDDWCINCELAFLTLKWSYSLKNLFLHFCQITITIITMNFVTVLLWIKDTSQIISDYLISFLQQRETFWMGQKDEWNKHFLLMWDIALLPLFIQNKNKKNWKRRKRVEMVDF